MSRELLFVQNGDGRPKCIRGWRAVSNDPATVFRDHLRADRWWLVECENAEAGRAAIKHYADRMVVMDKSACMYLPWRADTGRILSSGEKEDK